MCEAAQHVFHVDHIVWMEAASGFRAYGAKAVAHRSQWCDVLN